MIRNTGRGRWAGAESALELAVRYLARKDRTEAQVRAYLDRHHVPAAALRGVIRQLRSKGLLDDERYARRWAVQRLARRPMGRERLEAELEAQGLARRVIAAAVEEAFAGTTEREIAGRAAAASRRDAGWLRRRGFSEETIAAVLEDRLASRSGPPQDALNEP